MDSEDPPVDLNSPFATTAEQSKSRITDRMAQQKKPAQRPLSSTLKTGGMKAPTRQQKKQAQPFKPAVAQITRPAALQNINRRMDEVIARTPVLKLSEANIMRVRTLVGVQAGIILLLVGTLAYATLKLNDKNIYVARSHPRLELDANGRSVAGAADSRQDTVRLLQPMTTPTYTQAAVISWATATATSVMSFGFHNIDERLASIRQNFTARGWKAYTAALDNSNILNTIVAKEQVMTAAPVGSAVIVKSSVMPDQTHQWIVQIPFMVTTLSGKETMANRRVMTMTITQVSPMVSLAGLGIDNWIES